jgi:RND family efflux transporter MFP subunit
MALIVSTAALGAVGCSPDVHSHEGEADGLPTRSVTRWSSRTEVYAEHPVLVANRPAHVALHLTDLRTFEPVAEGHASIELQAQNGSKTVYRGGAPERPGIVIVDVAPPAASRYTWRVLLDIAGGVDTHDMGEVTVYPDAEAALAAPAPAEGAVVTFLKEQQWTHDFATVPAAVRDVRVVLRAPAFVRPAAGAEAIVAAPASGRFVGRAPAVGERVTEGQPLGQIEPRLEGLEDVTTLEAEVTTRRLAVVEARSEVARADLLLAARAVPARRVDQARHELDIARAALRAAEARLAHRQQTLAQGGSSAGSNAFALQSPIAGTLIAVSATPGAVYEAGATLFHVLRSDRVVVEVQVPETDAPRMGALTDTRLEIPGGEGPIPLDVRAVRTAGMIDASTRALPVWLEVDNRDRRLLIGQSATALLHTGDARPAVAIAASAVLTDSGRPVVFVQVGGEAFERRLVELGPRDGDAVAVVKGLELGDRVVTQGAYDIMLAATLTSRPAEGHVH